MTIRNLALLLALGISTGCSAVHPHATLMPLALAQEGNAPAARPLQEDHFTRDGSGGIRADHLKEVLDAPVFLASDARLGVVPVANGYEPGTALPLPTVPAALTSALEDSGLFQMATEVTTDWPTDRGIGGLRELAARYRTPYLLLYRQRFVDDSTTNGWAVLYPTIIGALVTPSQTLETDGVLEATLFDVESGTLLFTVYARVHDAANATIWHDDKKVLEMQSRLQAAAARALADEVVGKVRKLAALRPPPESAKTAALPRS